ncbi:hypothetical protein [Actinomadura sp. 6N118]|uniref:hypothetical protein n=1 Tax=Actinomadura sp. 6N118 TaxID=3375151 RepID=UPI0037918582
MTTPPPWVDDLFPFPTPPALAKLIDIAWEHAFTDEDQYDDGVVITHYDFMFDLACAPLAPKGWEHTYPGPSRGGDFVPLWATPELIQFGHLGTGICVGWVIPAPELQGSDHPVALFGHRPAARVIAGDTRAGLEWMLSLGLRKDGLRDDDRSLIARLAAELDINPAPEHGVTPDGRDVVVPLELAVPSGWRHVPSTFGVGFDNGIGVLAPADAFAEYSLLLRSSKLDEILTEAARLLDAGYPATALLELTDAFHEDPDRLPDLHPLWSRAYHDLGRPQYANRLDLMLATYGPER